VPAGEKIDILAYLFQANGFPACKAELPLNQKELETIQIVQKGEQAAPNFALVRLAGCLTPGSNRWSLITAEDGTFESVRRRAFPARIAYGSESRSLRSSVSRLREELLNLTSLDTTGNACPN
jgi:hypothetical protein